ncbi:MAG: xanthine phosphoribosyltransferase [Lachnospiraceae bacterium]|nr:xanthine phosphoribosyltransferase [Lachnospiraceae bacterium]
MKLLEDKILAEGRVYPGKVLKVGAFLNHQIDVPFLTVLGEEFYRLFKDENITKILTVETSGIAVAYPVAQLFNVPLLFGKKNKTKNLSDDCYCAKVTSYTHGTVYEVVVEKQFLTSADHVLLIDDFLANGCALEGLLDICAQAGATVAGAGIVIEKAFQDGGKKLRERGLRVESLARIADMDAENGITFISQD